MIQLEFGPGPGFHIQGIPDGPITPEIRAQLRPPPCPACGVTVEIHWISVATFADDPRNPPVVPGPWECPNECHPRYRRYVVARDHLEFRAYCHARRWNPARVIYLPGDGGRNRADGIASRLRGVRVNPAMFHIAPGGVLTVEDIHTLRVCIDPAMVQFLAGTDLQAYMDQVANMAHRERQRREMNAWAVRYVPAEGFAEAGGIDLTPFVDQIQFTPDGVEVSVDLRGEVGELPAWARRIAQGAQESLSIGFETDADDLFQAVEVTTMDGQYVRTIRVPRPAVQAVISHDEHMADARRAYQERVMGLPQARHEGGPVRGRTAAEVRDQVRQAVADADAVLAQIDDAVEWHPGPDAARWTPGDPTL